MTEGGTTEGETTDGGGTEAGRILVLGIGNLLWADEGFGVRAVETLHRRYVAPDAVTLMDGGTQGLYLVQHVREAHALLVFDAIDYGIAPGTLKVVRDEEVPRFTGCKKMSLHQTGFQDVLSAAGLLGGGPDRLTLIGVQAADLDTWGGSLSEAVRDRLDEAINLAVAELAAWGVPLTPRAEPLTETDQALVRHGLDLASYETGSPLAAGQQAAGG